ncbi:hypothetical protein D3C87_241700 [compost metagenome]
MKSLVTMFVVMLMSSATLANPRTIQEIGEKLQANAKFMRLVTAEHREKYGAADREVDFMLSNAEDVRFVCSPAKSGVESCVMTGRVKFHVPDGGPRGEITKVLIFNLIDGVASGDVTVAQ